MGSRMNCDLFWWLKKYGVKKTIKQKLWKHSHFWGDSFYKRFYKYIWCKLFGHQKGKFTHNDNTGNYDKPYCFRCQQDI